MVFEQYHSSRVTPIIVSRIKRLGYKRPGPFIILINLIKNALDAMANGGYLSIEGVNIDNTYSITQLSQS